jgi:MFS family permease
MCQSITEGTYLLVLIPTLFFFFSSSSLMLAVLLAALDQTIVATALPRISSDFNASDEIGWVCAIW